MKIHRIGKHCLKCAHCHEATDGRRYCYLSLKKDTFFTWLKKDMLKKRPDPCPHFISSFWGEKGENKEEAEQ